MQHLQHLVLHNRIANLFSFFYCPSTSMAQSEIGLTCNSIYEENTISGEKGAICPLCMERGLYFYCENCISNGSFTHSQDKRLERFAEKKLRLYEVNAKKAELLKRFEDVMESQIKMEDMKSEIAAGGQMNEHLRNCIDCITKEIKRTESKIKYLREKNQVMHNRSPRLSDKIFQMQKSVDSSISTISDNSHELNQVVSAMKSARQSNIEQLMQYIFPISKTDVDRKNSKYYDLDSHMEAIYVTGQWELAGESSTSGFQYNILESVIPANGNYSAYTDWTMRNTEEMGVAGSDEYLKATASSIISALSFVTHLVSVLGFYLDVYMPKRLTHSEFCGNELKRDLFLHKIAKLNANVIHLCLSQNVEPSLIRPHHTLDNIMLLLLVKDLGRTGPIEISQKLPQDVEDHLASDLLLLIDGENDNFNDDLSSDWVEVNEFADDSVIVCEFGAMTDQPQYTSHRPSLTGELITSLWRAATWQR